MSSKNKLIWLSICVALVYAMIIVGGYTRLTHSGLSIVEWKPISGIIPPLSEQSWQLEFSQYQQSPEFQQINHGMNLEEFKQIFLVEYVHRVLGRVTGLAFLLPFLCFFTKFSASEKKYFSGIAILMGLQGVIGWLMVQSGLINQPNVSQYRLALHLCTACIILMLLVWQITRGTSRQSKYGYFSVFLLFIQITSGAFVAGLHAGIIYNSFPLMDGELIPSGLFIIQPWYLNIFENVTMVQFIHRYLAIINVLNIIIYCFFILDIKRKIAIIIAALIIIQFMLGIFTLLFQVPLLLALLHQAVAIILLITMVVSLKGMRDA